MGRSRRDDRRVALGHDGVPGSVEATVALIARVRSRKREDDPAPGDWATRATAYGQFRDASLQSLADLEFLSTVGMPPRILGGMWSWPQAFRSFRRYGDSMHAGLLAIHEIATVGDYDVFEAASAVAERMGKLGQLFTASKGGREPQSDTFTEQLDSTRRAVIDFVLAARADLQKHPPGD